MRWHSRVRTVMAFAATVVVPATFAQSTAVSATSTVSVTSVTSAAAAPPSVSAPTPVETHGTVSVCGLTLCGSDGSPVRLRGMSTHGLQWYSQCVAAGSLDALAYDWQADVLRISMYVQEGGYETDPARFTAMVDRYIEEATRRGMYAIVDWHMLDPGDPAYNLRRAKTFFSEVAGRHRDKGNVLYEIANEPNGVSWDRIRRYAEEIIPVIRAQDPDSVVLVGTRGWSSLGVSEGADEREVIADPVNAPNIMYTFHFYAASHRDEYLNTLSRAAQRLPLFVTEFGTQDYAGEGSNDFAQTQRYLDLLSANNISWVNWNFSDDWRSGAVFKQGTCGAGPWTGTAPLKEAGVWIRSQLRAPAL